MLGNAVRRQTIITLAQAKSYALGLRFIRRATGLPVDLTGCTITFTMREESRFGGDVALTKVATIIDADLGVAQFPFQASDTNVSPGEYTYTVTLKTAENYSNPIMGGVVNVLASDETGTSGTYADINPSTSLAVYLESGDEVTIEVDKIDGFVAQVSQLMENFTADVAAELADAATTLQEQLTDQQASFNSRLTANELAVNSALAANEAAEAALLSQVGLAVTAAEEAKDDAVAAAAAAAQSAIDAANTVSQGMPIGSTTQVGAVEIATEAEQLEGLRDDVVSTPAGVLAVVEALTADKVDETLVNAKGDILVATAADVLARLAAGDEGQLLSINPATATGLEWIDPPEGGGGGGVVIDYSADTAARVAAVAALAPPIGSLVYMKAQVAAQTWDFRGLSALPAGWTRRGIASETFSATGMAASVSGGQGWYYDIGSAPSEITVTARIITGEPDMSGVGLVQASNGNGRLACWYNNSSGFYNLPVSNWSYGGPQVVNDGSGPFWPVWMRLTKKDGITVAHRSTNGVTWAPFGGVIANDANTLNLIFIGSVFNTDTTFKVEQVSLLAGASGGLLGWWDGAAIQKFEL